MKEDVRGEGSGAANVLVGGPPVFCLLSPGRIGNTIITATTAPGAGIDTLQVDLDALDTTDVKYVTGGDPTINLRAGTTITNLAQQHDGDITALDARIDEEIADRAALIRSETRTDGGGSPVLDARGEVWHGLLRWSDRTGRRLCRAPQPKRLVNAEMATSHQFKEIIFRGGVNYSW